MPTPTLRRVHIAIAAAVPIGLLASAAAPALAGAPDALSGGAIVADAPPLLVDAPANEAAAARAAADRAVMRSRLVTIDFVPLAGMASPTGGLRAGAAVQLNLFDDASFTAVFDHVAPGPPSDPNGFVLCGHLAERPDTSRAYLSVSRGVVVGDVAEPGLGTFEIRPTGVGDLHAVRQIDEARQNPCGTADRQVVGDPTRIGENPELPTQRSNGTPLIDVLIVYTPAARNQAGGDNPMQAALASWVAQTNDAYNNSNIKQRLRFRFAQLTDYVESGDGEVDLNRFTSPDDGFMDEVMAVRDAVGADEVHLVVANAAGICGIGWLMVNVSQAFEDSAFALTVYGCGALTFGHELGHNMGCAHDHQNGSVGAYCYSFGWRTPNNAWRTIMSYAPGTRIPYFSNPNVMFGGFPLGVFGDTCPADASENYKSMNNTAATVASFRESVEEVEPPGLFDLSSPLDGATLIGFAPTLSWSASPNAFGYTIVVATTPDLASPVWTRNNLNALSVMLPMNTLQGSTTYYWTVTAENSVGQSGATQGVYHFTTKQLADFNTDGSVNSTDLGILLGSWGPCPAPPAQCAADLNRDGAVTGADLALLLGGWGMGV